eukprot:TRINITY_DN1602_c0_g5_i1.p1 TRINITY_DN1602_c0_g5~~TRINITY_DN1602_c0_g5_i1.p1  ORF type:complete len:649 (+),score=218.33 TRINITY_DN1602_c0_g5_i1:59-2005(+)
MVFKGLRRNKAKTEEDFTDEKMAKKLDGFFKLAAREGHKNKVGSAANILKNKKYNGNPQALYTALETKYGDLVNELKWLDEWIEFVEKQEKEKEKEEKPKKKKKEEKEEEEEEEPPKKKRQQTPPPEEREEEREEEEEEEPEEEDNEPQISPGLPETDDDAVDRLSQFYELTAPANLPRVPTIWEHYKTCPSDFYKKLMTSYGDGQKKNLIWLKKYIDKYGPDSPPIDYMMKLDPERAELARRLQDFYYDMDDRQSDDRAKTVPKVLYNNKGKERDIAMALNRLYPNKEEELSFLTEFIERQERRGSKPPPPPREEKEEAEPSPRVTREDQDAAERALDTHRITCDLLRQQKELQDEIINQQETIRRQQEEITAIQERETFAVPRTPSPVSILRAPSQSPELLQRTGSSTSYQPSPLQGVDMKQLLDAGWSPPVKAQAQRSASPSVGSERSVVKEVLTQHLQSIKDVHKEIEEHQRAQLKILETQELINSKMQGPVAVPVTLSGSRRRRIFKPTEQPKNTGLEEEIHSIQMMCGRMLDAVEGRAVVPVRAKEASGISRLSKMFTRHYQHNERARRREHKQYQREVHAFKEKLQEAERLADSYERTTHSVARVRQELSELSQSLSSEASRLSLNYNQPPPRWQSSAYGV